MNFLWTKRLLSFLLLYHSLTFWRLRFEFSSVHQYILSFSIICEAMWAYITVRLLCFLSFKSFFKYKVLSEGERRTLFCLQNRHWPIISLIFGEVERVHSESNLNFYRRTSRCTAQWQLPHFGWHLFTVLQRQPPLVSPRPIGPQRLWRKNEYSNIMHTATGTDMIRSKFTCFVAQHNSVLHIEHINQSQPSRFMITIWNKETVKK